MRRQVASLTPQLGHPAPLTLLRMAAPGQSKRKIFGRPPPLSGSRSISRPSDRATEPASGHGPWGHDRSPKNIGGIRYARFHDANNQDWSLVSPACCTMAAA